MRALLLAAACIMLPMHVHSAYPWARKTTTTTTTVAPPSVQDAKIEDLTRSVHELWRSLDSIATDLNRKIEVNEKRLDQQMLYIGDLEEIIGMQNHNFFELREQIRQLGLPTQTTTNEGNGGGNGSSGTGSNHQVLEDCELDCTYDNVSCVICLEDEYKPVVDQRCRLECKNPSDKDCTRCRSKEYELPVVSALQHFCQQKETILSHCHCYLPKADVEKIVIFDQSECSKYTNCGEIAYGKQANEAYNEICV